MILVLWPSVADRVVVMYRGKIVEQGKVREIFQNPSHPYVKRIVGLQTDARYQISDPAHRG